MSALGAAAAAYGVVLLAELGDKSQLALLAMASRGHRWRVAAEAALAFLVLTLAATAAGALLADRLPRQPIQAAAGALFLLFAALAWRQRDAPAEATHHRWGGAFLAILLSELGDKTQLATAGLAGAHDAPWAVGAGAFLALATSTLLAVLAGGWLGRHVRPGVVRRAAALAFAAVGVLLLAGLVAWP